MLCQLHDIRGMDTEEDIEEFCLLPPGLVLFTREMIGRNLAEERSGNQILHITAEADTGIEY